MFFFKKKKPFYQRKKFVIPVSVIVFLIALRMVLPTVVKIGLNSYLKDFSPTFIAHVDNVDLAILRGVYAVTGVTAEYKKNETEFLSINSVQASVPWRDLFKGKVVADVALNQADLTYSDSLLPAVKEHLAKQDEEDKDKDDDDDKKKKDAAFSLARFDVNDTVIRTNMFPSLTRAEGVVITHLQVRATNLNPTEEVQRTPFSVEALLLGSGKFKTEGEADLYNKPLKWTIDSEMKNFDLTGLNRFLKKKVPLTFTKGKIDVYAEAATQGGPIKGYVKPFIKGLDVIKSKEHFLGPKHWLIEVITALGNVVMKSDQTMATRVPFTFDKEFKPDGDVAISKAFEHGFTQELNRGIENTISLDKKITKQAQEAR